MEYNIKTIADLESACQLAANAGLAIHAIEVSTECNHCSSDIVLDNPVLEIIKSEDNNSVKLLFKNKN